MASAAQITRFSPEGGPAGSQVAIRFDEAMVPMGDLKAAAGGGVLYRRQRWRQRALGQRHQLGLRLRARPAPGVRCSVRMSAGLKSVAGKAYAGKPNTGSRPAARS
jgi:hypothetical protein